MSVSGRVDSGPCGYSQIVDSEELKCIVSHKSAKRFLRRNSNKEVFPFQRIYHFTSHGVPDTEIIYESVIDIAKPIYTFFFYAHAV